MKLSEIKAGAQPIFRRGKNNKKIKILASRNKAKDVERKT